ncbi:hypothetical protein B0T26DRAFT_669502 [Lasiosphaeria miniovina]|uniref:Nuclear transport factor 2 n=1 Tax=Lasiosphaeria miniovina TaxID=1954250 RepID=A0AA40BF07_9PEZI|nr:uncharacterized protein B0T26DRAFT_669502 [Lasiosphaeria miniovina]KAK0733050.1 hypothetical protein B0T26DRAFT_669502 [Lasiosphaeria miniovina]
MKPVGIDPEALELVKYYYEAFNSDRHALDILFRDDSTMSWEGNLWAGTAAITQMLVDLPFHALANEATSCTMQQTMHGGVVASAGNEAAEVLLQYAQTMVLAKDLRGYWYIQYQVVSFVDI